MQPAEQVRGSADVAPGHLNVDGFGGQEVKIAKYNDFTNPPVRHVHAGFKLFYKEDTNTMTPAQVLELRPRPDVVIYE